ncbi:acyloxyacyl hydrolase [Flavobacteriaceae bacterium S356]|uniref:Acyloxyacyl hydrolase n=1 Tax=Asprobacillus argus TaxID=3076534 RepID=A0ABU3LEG8_9FLAO|nr:acyloxyacyl hydrolase [Flavobacteriaceae bacterium S356]
MHLNFPPGKKYTCLLFLFCVICGAYGQNTSKSWIKPKEVGLLLNKADEKNFLFDDNDYFYQTTTIKGQLLYTLFAWKKFEFNLIVQPQYQRIKHQLLNPSFIGPEIPDYLIKRAVFTTLKSINLYAMEFGISIHRAIAKKLTTELTVGLGFAFIDTETERLAKGFTFIENGSLGISYNTSERTSVYFGGNIGHVSNFEFKQPNDGYNIIGYEIGFRYTLK